MKMKKQKTIAWTRKSEFKPADELSRFVRDLEVTNHAAERKLQRFGGISLFSKPVSETYQVPKITGGIQYMSRIGNACVVWSISGGRRPAIVTTYAIDSQWDGVVACARKNAPAIAKSKQPLVITRR